MTMTRRAVGKLMAGFLLLATPAMAAESPAELISSFRLKHGEVGVVPDATLDRIALEQARAMAAKNDPSHEVIGPFRAGACEARCGEHRLRLRQFREDARSADRLIRAPQKLSIAQSNPH